MDHCACIRHDVIVPLSTQFRNHKVNKVGNKGKTFIKPPGGRPPEGPGPPPGGRPPEGPGPPLGASSLWGQGRGGGQHRRVSLLPDQPPSGPVSSVSYKNQFYFNF